jgi:hypothetical protein
VPSGKTLTVLKSWPCVVTLSTGHVNEQAEECRDCEDAVLDSIASVNEPLDVRAHDVKA